MIDLEAKEVQEIASYFSHETNNLLFSPDRIAEEQKTSRQMRDLDICWIKIISDSRYRYDLRNEASAIIGRKLGERSVFMDNNAEKIWEHVKLYFRKHLPEYTVLEIRRKSCHPEDSYLWIVSAEKKDGTYAVWTAWNESMQSLNHGHYGIKSLEDCEDLIREYINAAKYFTVYRCAQTVKLQMFIADSEEQARQFCEDHSWEWKDENDFLWSLDYQEL